eukprot:TRINITY_DN24005_c0_g1_i2.p1 TRINITY_DN24005_c0_g1~~TRINITY_DN24005_c0_g1_i2.p1  ORF type:complete len:268 (+),score=7.45 TRINITY_DN24005_c0_g1_i2:344-1147(+)
MSQGWRPPYTVVRTSDLFSSPPDLIDDKLYLGNVYSASDRELLDKLGIKSIISIASNLGPPKFPESYKYTEISILDCSDVNIRTHFDRCFTAIDEGIKAGGVLVHCVAGMSRSATIVILYLGNVYSASDRELLDKLGIKSIISIASNLGPPKFPESYKYTEISILDCSDVNIRTHFDRCFTAIDEGIKAGGVLVHCVAGMSRSATIVIAYLMKKKGLSLRESFAHVKKCRPIAQPNYGFMRQLEQFEAYLSTKKEGAQGGCTVKCHA